MLDERVERGNCILINFFIAKTKSKVPCLGVFRNLENLLLCDFFTV